MHFTGDQPPAIVLEKNYNWACDLGREGRSGCDETTAYVQRKDDYIYESTDYTAGDVWFPDDESYLALISVTDRLVSRIYVYEEDDIWEIAMHENGKWKVCPWRTMPGLSLGDETRFPLRYCSRLQHIETKKHVSGKLLPDATSLPWDPNELWGS